MNTQVSFFFPFLCVTSTPDPYIHIISIILLNALVTNYFNLLSASLFLGAIRQFIKRVLFQKYYSF